jgi:hypothetical protein
MLGAFGSVLLFLIALMGTVVVGTYALGYAARCLLVVVQDTAAGSEEPTWPEEPTLDWLGQSAHVAALPVLVLVPVGFLVRGLSDTLFPRDPGLRFLVMAVPALWLFFPVALLSSLASYSRWNVFRPLVLARLARLFPATAIFYLCSGVLAAVLAAVWYFTLFPAWGWFVLPAAAIVTGVLWLVYARLIGRLAWLIGRLGPLLPEAKTDEDEAPVPKKRKRKQERSVVTDPWAVPEEAADEEAEAEAEPPPKLPVDGYDLSGDAPLKPPPLNVLVGDISRVTDKPGERPARRGDKAKKKKKTAPAGPKASELPMVSCLFRGLAGFPFGGQPSVALLRLSFGFLAFGLGLTAMLAFFPF